MQDEVIAEYTLVGQRAEGAEFPVQLAIRKPTLSVKLAPAWECVVSIDPLWHRPFAIYGDNSFQALCLAVGHLVRELDAVSEQGIVLKYPDGELFEAKVFRTE